MPPYCDMPPFLVPKEVFATLVGDMLSGRCPNMHCRSNLKSTTTGSRFSDLLLTRPHSGCSHVLFSLPLSICTSFHPSFPPQAKSHTLEYIMYVQSVFHSPVHSQRKGKWRGTAAGKWVVGRTTGRFQLPQLNCSFAACSRHHRTFSSKVTVPNLQEPQTTTGRDMRA
jgi:hypothetical protein